MSEAVFSDTEQTARSALAEAEARVAEASSREEEVEALATLARAAAEAGAHRRAAEALTAALDHEDRPSTASRLRIAELHLLAGQIDLARDWIDRARWMDASDPVLGEALARVAAAQGDPVGVADAEACAPVAAARAWIRIGRPDRAAALVRRLGEAGSAHRGARAEAAAASGDADAVRAALGEEHAERAERGETLAAFLVGSALVALGGGDADLRRRIAALRPALSTQPRRRLSASERARLGLSGAAEALEAPTAPEAVARAARGVARLLGCGLRPGGRAGGDLGRLRFAWARAAFGLEASAAARDRVALLAAVDPGPPIAEAPPQRQLELAARVLDPEHVRLLGVLGLGLDIPEER